ncbi:glycosyltransferase family 4 protein [Aeromicrobium senzhongii]|uniref:Glycosyltransferase family 4 protein n=1 Tax=Aeromicrobium senzhongii TaxID=2663859 RepID=A0ABX6SUP3_9ACTN|nr:glycosyltransferase family 4 protein [Aeromicrobium senzhongii]QNL94987.1 glycosyltransferase family 4 protein [Aeromicrobium senzhongii]
MAETEFVFPVASSTWSERHARGEVPGLWPYGLERIDRPGRPVAMRHVSAPSRGARLAWRLRPRAARNERLGLAWDEGTAHAMAASRRYGRMHCGVIWATDRLDQADGRATAGVRRTLSAMQSVWVLSRGQLDAVDRLVGSSTPSEFVKFGVDDAFFSPAPYPEQPLLFSAGGDRDRDHETILAAFAQVVRARPHVKAVVQTRARASAPGVTVVPHLSHLELREFYRRSSVVAIATRPNLHVSGMTVSLEAQATGRPVILTHTPGAEDYVDDGVTGFLMSSQATDRWVERLIDLVDDPARAASMGHEARRHVEDEFTCQHLANRLATAVGLA